MQSTTTIDLRKVQFATFFWRNQYGQRSRIRPRKPTVNGQVFDPDARHCDRVRVAGLKIIGVSNGESWYEFDYENQEAVIYVADKTIPLVEYCAEVNT
jgi:hypothetical protein